MRMRCMTIRWGKPYCCGWRRSSIWAMPGAAATPVWPSMTRPGPTPVRCCWTFLRASGASLLSFYQLLGQLGYKDACLATAAIGIARRLDPQLHLWLPAAQVHHRWHADFAPRWVAPYCPQRAVAIAAGIDHVGASIALLFLQRRIDGVAIRLA